MDDMQQILFLLLDMFVTRRQAPTLGFLNIKYAKFVLAMCDSYMQMVQRVLAPKVGAVMA